MSLFDKREVQPANYKSIAERSSKIDFYDSSFVVLTRLIPEMKNTMPSIP
jgi:hypothetical protein